MFDETIRELQHLQGGIRMPLDLPTDADGYVDRMCPGNGCSTTFRVLLQDWHDKVPDERVYCPRCRHEAHSDEWNTQKQAEFLERTAVVHVDNLMTKALQRDARRFNRRYDRGLIRMSMNVTPSDPSPALPLAVVAAMRQRFTCEHCTCRYASVGAAFFCPACGHNSALSTFDRTVEIVRNTVNSTSAIREALTVAHDNDAAQDAVRQLLEDQLTRLVGAFECLAEALFDQFPNSADFRRTRGVFQRLVESSQLWRDAVGKGYDGMLRSPELRDLNLLFQQRHVLAHRQGIVDQDYITKSGDTTYAIGQRLVIRKRAVLRLAHLIAKLAAELRKVAAVSA